MTRRCPTCGGLVGADAQWCGQCLTRLDEPAGPPSSTPPEPGPRPGEEVRPVPVAQDERARPAGPGRPIRATDQGIVWDCPTCETPNPIESTTCRVCGTAFGRLFSEEPAGPEVDPRRAMALSLLFPGIGHFVVGRAADGMARVVIFGYTLATAVSVLVARAGGGIGPFLPLLLISAAAGVTLYVLSAVDAARLARRDVPLLSTRSLLYGAVGLMLLTIGNLVILGFRAGGQS